MKKKRNKKQPPQHLRKLIIDDFITDVGVPRLTQEERKCPKNWKRNARIWIYETRCRDFPVCFDDFMVESKPTFCNHARVRLKEGRQGKYITRKSRRGHRRIVVTVLPKHFEHKIPKHWDTHKIPLALKFGKYSLNKKLDEWIV